MSHLALCYLICLVGSVTSHYNCEYPSFDDFLSSDDYPDTEYPSLPPRKSPPSKNEPPETTARRETTKIPVTQTTQSTSQSSSITTPRPTPPVINSESDDAAPRETILLRVATGANDVQQKHVNELKCLQVLDDLISSQWQEEIDKLSVVDFGNFSTLIKVPEFKTFYSNPESEWLQDEEMATKKLDKCVRNLVSKTAPRMNQEEIDCLNKMYSDYFSLEIGAGSAMDKLINESFREQLPFKSVYTYFEMTELLFDNRNIDSLDAELRAVHEDMLEFYIKTEEDKARKIFIVEQECEWKNARILREASSENDRYEKFTQLVKSLVNSYLTAEILHKWIPGETIPEYRYNTWNRMRSAMENEIKDEVVKLQNEKRDAQYLCTRAAELATKLFDSQKMIFLETMNKSLLSSDLKTHDKYSYVVALRDLIGGKNDERLSRVELFMNEFKEGHYCLTNFIRMIEHHQRHALASLLIEEILPYGITYCHVKEVSDKLIFPRYCRCQGTFCEKFGLATLRAERFELNLLPNGTYIVATNPSYRILPLDELISTANQRIAQQKFNTWWYRNQKMPASTA